MLYLACYDIDDDKIRLKLADCLLAYGLERIQRSVFVGSLDDTLQPRLIKEVAALLGKPEQANEQFMLMPLGEFYARSTYWLGLSPPDWSYHLNQTHTLIF